MKQLSDTVEADWPTVIEDLLEMVELEAHIQMCQDMMVS